MNHTFNFALPWGAATLKTPRLTLGSSRPPQTARFIPGGCRPPDPPRKSESRPAGSQLLYGMQKCFRAVNRPSGLDFGRTATGKAPKLALRPDFGRPEGRVRCFPSSSPAKIRPGRPIYGPEALLCNIDHHILILELGFYAKGRDLTIHENVTSERS
jgi:hypothetical protein